MQLSEHWVEPGAATVCVALKAPQKVTLEVWAGEAAAGNRPARCRRHRVTARIGEHMHVLAVTTSGQTLAPELVSRRAAAG